MPVIRYPFATVNAGPHGILIDSAGNVYVLSGDNTKISKVTPRGDSTINWATLPSPANDMVMDSAGNIFTMYSSADGNLSKIMNMILPSGAVISPWVNTLLDNPKGIAIDANGTMYMPTDNTFPMQPMYLTRVSSAGVITQNFATLERADHSDVIIDSAYNIFVSEVTTNRINKVTSGGVVTLAWATLSTHPRMMAIDANNTIYIISDSSNVISKITAAGTVTQAWATLLHTPIGIAVDRNGNVFTGNSDGTISKVAPDGSITQAYATNVGATPVRLAIDKYLRLYTCNAGESNISRVDEAIQMAAML